MGQPHQYPSGRALLVGTALAVFFSAHGCSDPGASCVPGTLEACVCPNETEGVRTCTDDGIFEACVCGATIDATGYRFDAWPPGPDADAVDRRHTLGTDASTDAGDTPPSDTAEDTDTPSDSQILSDATSEDVSDIADVTPSHDAQDTDTEDAGPDGNDEDDSGPFPEPLPPLYQVLGDCAEPLDYTLPECDGVACPGGYTCMGYGYCVPATTFALDDAPPGPQSKVSLAIAGDGGFAAAWYDVYYPTPDFQNMDVYFRLHAADGSPIGDAEKVDQDAMPWARSPSMVRMHDGRFLITWRGQEGFSGEVRYLARIVGADGVPEDDAFQLNETALVHETGSGTNVDSPFPKVLRDGRIAVTWMGRPEGATEGTDIFVRLLNEEAVPLGGELDVGGQTEHEETSPVVTDREDGGLVVMWSHGELVEVESDKPGPPTMKVGYTLIKGRFFSPLLQPTDDVITLSPGYELSEAMACATAFEDGPLFVTWKSEQVTGGTNPSGIKGHLLSSFGSTVTGTVHLFGSDGTGAYPFYAPVDVAALGRAAVVWHNYSGAGAGVFLRRYYPAEDVIDCETTEVTAIPGPGEGPGPRIPAVLGFPDGRILIGWQASSGGVGTRIYLRYLK